MKIDVIHVAKLANLKLNESQIKTFEKQLQSILDYIDKLKKADTTKIEETSQITGLENVTRNDKTSPSLSQEEALSNTKSTHNGLFKVKGILNGQ